ncbi:MAG: rhodanese-like domain-containing protein [Thermomicrobiales bacterium]
MFKSVMSKLMGGGAQETDVATVVEGLAAGTITVVDVREQDEWRAGHIRGAIHIPLGSLGERTAKIDRSKPVVTVCRSGMRSLRGADTLRAAGFEDVRSMAGGMNAWVSARQPVAR